MARGVAAGAVVLAVAALALLLLRGGDYGVRAQFVNASQLVNGNLVKVAGESVGKVTDISVTPDGQAEVAFTVGEDYAPLRRGTRAVVRVQSLSGVANRYIDLHLGPNGNDTVPDGGLLETSDTESAVELDQLFNIFDEETREDTKRTIRLFSEFTAGRAEENQQALRYLSPALAASSRLFEELAANDTQLERFVVETSQLVSDLGARDEELASLVSNLAQVTDAVASERASLGDAVRVLPDFLRRANTTFVNLRATLDDLDPLVEEAEPLVRGELPDLLAELRPLAQDAVPTVQDLSRTIRRPGAGNDLVELLRAQAPVAEIATESAQRNGEERPGAFEAMQRGFRGVAPQFAFARPYSVDAVGWFDDFSHSGVYDALGGFSRAGLQFNAFTFTPALGGYAPLPAELRDEALATNLAIGRNNRCPGSSNPPAEDGSNPWRPSADFNCDPTQLTGTLP